MGPTRVLLVPLKGTEGTGRGSTRRDNSPSRCCHKRPVRRARRQAPKAGGTLARHESCGKLLAATLSLEALWLALFSALHGGLLHCGLAVGKSPCSSQPPLTVK